jgi:hypothetical protein
MAKPKYDMKVSKAFIEELRTLSTPDAETVLAFLQHLVENPYDQTLIESAAAKGDLFASSVAGKLYVYWSFDLKSELPDLNMQPKIVVLGLARKRANRGRVPLLPVMDEDLKSV